MPPCKVEETSMQNSTWSNALLAALASLALVCTPVPALAQHGGGHGGGGGGFHGGGFSGGGFHGGSGGFHGGGFSGAHAGSFGYGSRGVSGSQGARGFEGGRGSYGMRSGSPSMGRSSRPWGSEGEGVRNTSPGWHGFERSAGGGRQGAGGSSRAASGLSGAGASRASMAGRGASTFHSAVADGQWHSFGAAHGANSLVAANLHTGFNSFHDATFVSTGLSTGPPSTPASGAAPLASVSAGGGDGDGAQAGDGDGEIRSGLGPLTGTTRGGTAILPNTSIQIPSHIPEKKNLGGMNQFGCPISRAFSAREVGNS